MSKITYISFPGLGIDEFPVKNVAISIGNLSIMWYGIIITFGILLAFLYFDFRGKKYEGLSDDDIFDYSIAGVFFGILGARIYYVATEFDAFRGDSFLETLKNCVAIWNGGLGFYGGLILGLISVVVISAFKKKNPLKVFDAASLGVMIAQIFGRWGNFMNGEAHGGETDLPWRMGLRLENESAAVYYHPTFFYESLWNLIGFVIINFTYSKKKYNGQIVLRYLTWYGFGRMFIEGLRTDSLYVGDFRISQVVGFLCFFFGSAALISLDIITALRNRDKKNAEKAEDNGVTVADEETDYVENEPSESDVEADEATEEDVAENKENTGVDIASLHASAEEGDE